MMHNRQNPPSPLAPNPADTLSLQPEMPSRPNPYQAPGRFDDDDDFNFDGEYTVELASGWRRIAAVWLNYLPLALLGVGAAIIVPFFKDNPIMVQMGPMLLLLPILAYGIYQLVIMIRDGQSWGKKVMGIRVITADGENPGFVRYVLLREFAYGLIINLISLIPILGSLVALIAAIICLVFLFMDSRDRQTLQDMLAKTLVVRA